MEQAFGNPKHRGKHVIVVGGDIFFASSGEKAKQMLEALHKKYPKRPFSITYIPKSESLILWV